MAKLPAEIRLKTKNLPPVVQDWMVQYMEWHGVKGTYFAQHIIVSYWETQIREKVQKIEFVNPVPQTPADSPPVPENPGDSRKLPEIPKAEEAIPPLNTDNFF